MKVLCVPCVDTGFIVAIKFITFIIFWILNGLIVIRDAQYNANLQDNHYFEQFLIRHFYMCLVIYFVKFISLLIIIDIILVILIIKKLFN